MKKLTIGILATIALAVIIPTAAFAEYKHDFPEISGTITASDSMSENIKLAKIHFSVATAVAENAVDNGQAIQGKLGVVQGFLVYKFKVASDDLVHKVIVDAGNGFTLYTSEGRSIDDYKHKWSEHGDKWSEHKDKMSEYKSKFGSYFSDLTPEEKQAQMAKFKEMKQALDAISEEDRNTIITHFKELKEQYAELSDEEHSQKHVELKAMMEEFFELSFDEKIEHLVELANSIRN